MALVYISIGSNLNDPAKQITQAIYALQRLPNITLHAASSLYKTKPLHCTPQPDFINAVVALHTNLSPESLFTVLQNIEHAQGRTRSGSKNQPRTLDLDLLLYDDLTLNTTLLTLPHARLYERNFVLIPLLEIAPELPSPFPGMSLADRIKQLQEDEQQRVEPL